MGAIEHEGYRFEIEYSVLLRSGRQKRSAADANVATLSFRQEKMFV
ncbi:DUF5370 family protein [Geobacillus sp. LEMMY01]|nr:DUF5370 family protein [Geobacillus sp. LEMMY01]